MLMSIYQPSPGRISQPNNSQTVLVTGAAGYLGSQLIRDMGNLFPQMTIRLLDNMTSGGHQALMQLPPGGRYEFVEGDILDPSAVRLALQGVDTVIHLAAIVSTPMSFENPTWLAQVNHWGTAHLVEACLETDVKRFIFTSTTAVYGPGLGFSETDSCHPQGVYAQSKRQAEKVVLTAAERGLAVMIVRLGTLYGLAPTMRFVSVVNRLAYLAGIKKPVTVYGDGRQMRSILHVRDASDLLCFLLKQPASLLPSIFNGVDQTVSILDVVELLQQLCPDILYRYTEQDIRTHLSFGAAGTAVREVGWQPQISLENGLAELLQQFRAFYPLLYVPHQSLNSQ